MKKIKYILFILLLLFTFQRKTFAYEITTKITASYKLELVKDSIHPRKAILEGKNNLRGELNGKDGIFGYADIVSELRNHNDFWEPTGKAVCEKNPAPSNIENVHKFGEVLQTFDRCWNENAEGWEYYHEYYDTYPSGSYTDTSSTHFFNNKSTIEYTITDTLDAYVLHGDTCKSAGGCIAVTNQIEVSNPSDSKLLAVYNKMNNALVDRWRGEFGLTCNTIGQEKAKKGSYKYDKYQLGEYDTYTDCKYSAPVYALFDSLEKAGLMNIDGKRQLLYANIDKLEDISKIRNSNKEGNYVCVAVHKTYTNKIEQSDPYIVLDTQQKDKQAAVNVCESIFRTDLFDAGIIINEEKINGKVTNRKATINVGESGTLNFWTFAVYKVVRSDVKTDSLPVNKTSSGLTCGWNYTPSGGSPEVVSFSVGASLSGGKLKFSDIKNIDKLHAAIYLTPKDMQSILNQDESALSLFQNNISYSDHDTNVNTVLAVLAGVVAVKLHVAAAIVTGGASIALSIASTAVGIGAVGLAIVALPTELANYVGKKTGTYSVPDVYIRFHDNPNKGQAVSGVVCNFVDFRHDFGIDSNYEASCEGILSGKFGEILSYILNIIRIAGCAILILFGVMDFVKPIISGDAELLQKSGNKFIKRLIVFVLILFVPALVKLLLSLIDKTSCKL